MKDTIEERTTFENKYRYLCRLLDRARERDQKEMQEADQYPIYQGSNYEGTAAHPTHTITKWIVDGRPVKVRRPVE